LSEHNERQLRPVPQVWSSGQDAVRVIKSRLIELVPSIRIFLE
jgi:hypothetical protein